MRPGEEITRRDGSGAAHALRHHLGLEGGRDEAPFGGGIGMGEAAAEGTARADRRMGDVARDRGEKRPQRPRRRRAVERRVPHASADGERAVHRPEPVEPGHAIDVDEMRRPGEAERHGRHQALAAGENAPVLRRHIGQRSPPLPRASRARDSGRAPVSPRH